MGDLVTLHEESNVGGYEISVAYYLKMEEIRHVNEDLWPQRQLSPIESVEYVKRPV